MYVFYFLIFLIMEKLDDRIEKLREYFYKNQKIPSLREGVEILWYKSFASVQVFYNKLIKMWMLSKNDKNYSTTDKLVWLVLYESVAASFDVPAKDEVKFQINFANQVIPRPMHTDLVKIEWESMVWAWIHSGDVAIVDRFLKPKIGNIVTAVVDSQSPTIKYYMKDENQKVFLQSDWEVVEKIYPKESLKILGVVTWIYKPIHSSINL